MIEEQHLYKNTLIGKTLVPKNYNLTFHIHPLGKVLQKTNIMHFTSTGKNDLVPGSRNPAIFFRPDSTLLTIHLGTLQNALWGIEPTTSLPTKQTTRVRILVFGKTAKVYFNQTLVGVSRTFDERPSGIASVYITNPWNEPAYARLTLFSFREITADPFVEHPLEETFRLMVKGKSLVRNKFLDTVEVPQNFNLSFSITPTGTVSTWANIMHFSKSGSNCCESGSRMPAVFFKPGSTKLSVIIGNSANGNWGLEPILALPEHQLTYVTIAAYKGRVNVYFNRVLVSFVKTELKRPSGYAQVHMADAYHEPAKAVLKAFSFVKLAHNPFSKDLTLGQIFTKLVAYKPLKQGTFLRVKNMTENYELTFSIHPTGLVRNTSSNIMHFTMTGASGSQMPAIYFRPNSTQLIIRLGTVKDSNWGVNPIQTLPMNQTTIVRIVVFAGKVDVFYNSRRVITGETTEKRHSGLVLVYMSNPQSTPAKAILKKFSLKKLTTNPFTPEPSLSTLFTNLVANRPLVAGTFLKTENVPVNFNLTFTIVPNFTRSTVFANILHFTTTGANCCAPGTRMPAIWFIPGTTRLKISLGNVKDGDWGVSTAQALPIYKKTVVSVIVDGGRVDVLFNNRRVVTAVTNEKRPSGLAQVYMSNSYSPSAGAKLLTFSLDKLAKHLPAEQSLGELFLQNIANKPLVPGTFLRLANVSKNFNLSFSIKPRHLVASASNIMLFATTSGSPMPAVWFNPNSTRLQIRLGTQKEGVWTISTAQSLALHRFTDVTIAAYNGAIQVFFNNNRVLTTFNNATRLSGIAQVYMSAAETAAANVILKSFSFDNLAFNPFPKESNLVKYFNQLVAGKPMVRGTFLKQKNVPANYNLTFSILPKSKSSVGLKSSVMIFVQNGKYCCGSGLQTLGVWFAPNSTLLSIQIGTKTIPKWTINPSRPLAINKETIVSIVTFGSTVKVYFDGRMVRDGKAPSDRLLGPANVYMSAPELEAAKAILSQFSMKTLIKDPFQKERTLIQIFSEDIAGKPLKKGTFLISHPIPLNYNMTFAIIPNKVLHTYSNILLFTKTDGKLSKSGTYMPSVGLLPGSTRLQVRFGTLLNPIWGVSTTQSLPLGKRTVVSIVIFNGKANIYFNGNLVVAAFTNQARPSGRASVYMSDPSSAPASAILKAFSLKYLAENPFPDVYLPILFKRISNKPLVKGTFLGLQNVTENYNLSFTIRPRGIRPVLTNIMHFTKDGTGCGTPGSRMPAVYFIPGSTRLSIALGTIKDGNWGMSYPTGLPLHQTTAVRFSIFKGTSHLFFNGTKVYSTFTKVARPSGLAQVYMSNSWDSPANATLSAFNFSNFCGAK